MYALELCLKTEAFDKLTHTLVPNFLLKKKIIIEKHVIDNRFI